MNRHKQPESVGGIVTSDSVHTQRRPRRNLLFAGGGAIIILVLILVWLIHAWVSPAQKLPVVHNTTAQVNPVTEPDRGVTAAKAAAQGARTNEEKLTAYTNLGAAYLNNNQPAEAVGAYQKASAIDANDIDVLTGIAGAYQANGQIAQAIGTYQKLINLFQQSKDQVLVNQIPAYQSLIQELQGAKQP